MKKSYFKFFGLECLYMLLNILAACISAMIQFIGRIHTGDYADIFSGSSYSYNIFFYLLGLCAYIACLIFSYKYFFSRKTDILNTSSLGIKVLYISIILLFSFIMLVALVFVFLFKLGLTDYMKPDILYNLTLYGFPVMTAVYLTASALLRFKRKE